MKMWYLFLQLLLWDHEALSPRMTQFRKLELRKHFRTTAPYLGPPTSDSLLCDKKIILLLKWLLARCSVLSYSLVFYFEILMLTLLKFCKVAEQLMKAQIFSIYTCTPQVLPTLSGASQTLYKPTDGHVPNYKSPVYRETYWLYTHTMGLYNQPWYIQ